MDNNKLKRTNRILIFIIIICIVAIIIMVALWPENTKKGNLTNKIEVTSNVNSFGSVSGTTAVGDNTNIAEMMKIKTPYCKLNYPKAWSDNLKYKEKEENGVFSETFYCCIKEQEIEMFTIYFGETEVGIQLGYIIKDGKKVSISVDVKTFETDDTWTDEEKTLLNNMTEGVNDVIISVTSNKNFSEKK